MPPPENVNFPVFIMVPVLTFYWQVKYQNPIKKLGNVEYFGLVLCMQFTLLKNDEKALNRCICIVILCYICKTVFISPTSLK